MPCWLSGSVVVVALIYVTAHSESTQDHIHNLISFALEWRNCADSGEGVVAEVAKRERGAFNKQKQHHLVNRDEVTNLRRTVWWSLSELFLCIFISGVALIITQQICIRMHYYVTSRVGGLMQAERNQLSIHIPQLCLSIYGSLSVRMSGQKNGFESIHRKKHIRTVFIQSVYNLRRKNV